MNVLIILFGIVGIMLAVLVGYLLLLTVAAWFAPSKVQPDLKKVQNRFLFIIPAYNEEELLPLLLQCLVQLDYPADLYSVHVVADNCTDDTAQLAGHYDAIVHERNDAANLGKGHALQWLLDKIYRDSVIHDAVIILDADTVVSSDFLCKTNTYLNRGARAIQAYYSVRDPQQSWSVGLRAAALSAIHYLRPQGRMLLGASAGLKGNGMVFHNEILRKHPWSTSITEDIEYHMQILLNGESVLFAPDVLIEAEMPSTLDNAETQNRRWEQGRLQMAQKYVPELFSHAFRALGRLDFQRAYVLTDAIMEHLIPPVTILAAISCLYLVSAIIFNLYWAILIGLFLVVGQALYVFAGMLLTNTPWRTYLSLLYVPTFIFWKLWIYLRILFGPKQDQWIRTARNSVQGER